jgi:hypothetical protein
MGGERAMGEDDPTLWPTMAETTPGVCHLWGVTPDLQSDQLLVVVEAFMLCAQCPILHQLLPSSPNATKCCVAAFVPDTQPPSSWSAAWSSAGGRHAR